jgi:hypothetical protein
MVIHPRRFDQVLNDAMGGLARVWRSLLIPAVAVSVPVSIATIVAFGATGGADLLDLVLNDPGRLRTIPEEVFWELARPFYVAVGIAAFLQMIGGVFVALASHASVAAELHGEPLTAGEATREAMRRYPTAFGAALVILGAVLALIGLGAAIWLIPIVSVGTPNSTTALVAVLLLGALLGPGIWAAVSVSMTTSAVAIEHGGVFGSILRSLRLVRGRWIAIPLIQLIALPLAALGGGGSALTVASGLGVLAQGLLVAAISAMYTYWYIDLRARKEGLSTDDLG